MDAVIYDIGYKSELAHVEYENTYSNLEDEIEKLQKSNPPLKVLIADSFLESDENENKFLEWVSSRLIPKITKAIITRPDTEWLLLYSLTEKVGGWKGIKYSLDDGKMCIKKLEE